MRSAAKGVKPCNFASHSTNKTDCNKPRASNKVFNVVHTHLIVELGHKQQRSQLLVVLIAHKVFRPIRQAR